MNQDEIPQVVNQTHFSYEEPLFEQPPKLPSKEPEAVVSQKWFRTRKGMMLIVAGALLVVLLLLVMVAYLAPRRPQPDQIGFGNRPTPSPSLTPNQVRIKDLQTELDAADPAKQEFPFPPVQMDIVLPDPNKKR